MGVQALVRAAKRMTQPGSRSRPCPDGNLLRKHLNWARQFERAHYQS